MALPSILEKNNLQSERESLGLLKEQRDIMKKLSDSIISSQREYGSLRKDMNDLRREFMVGVNTFSEMRKYFEDMRADKVKEKRIETKENKGPGFFSAAIAKLLGKDTSTPAMSSYQEKLLEETSTIKTLSSDTNSSIRFIKKSYEPNVKAKERKLLAEEIADAIGGDRSKGLIAGIAGAIGAGLATLGSALISGIGGKIMDAFEALAKLLGVKTAAGALPGAPGADKTGKDTKQKQEKKSGFLGVFGSFLGKVGLGVGIAAAPSMMGNPEETYQKERQEFYKNNPMQLEKDVDEVTRLEQFRKSKYSDEYKQNIFGIKDPEEQRMAIMQSMEEYHQALEASGDKGKAELEKMDQIYKDTRDAFLRQQGFQIEQEKKKTELTDEQVKNKQEETDLYTVMKEKLKSFTDGFDADSAKSKLAEEMKNAFKFDLGNGQFIDLFPGLSKGMAGMVDELGLEVQNLKSDGGNPINTAVSSVTNIGGGTTTVFPDASARSSDIDSYRNTRPLR